jgi:hypothetical protein
MRDLANGSVQSNGLTKGARKERQVNIDRNAIIAGRPAREVRDMLRKLGGEFHRSAVGDLLDDFIAAGLIEPTKSTHKQVRGSKDWYDLTTFALSLRQARFIKRLDRARAEKIVDALIERVRKVNINPDLIYRVADLRVFGSYITDATDFGDIDVAYRLAFKEENGDIVEANKRRAEASGRDFSNFIDEISYGGTEVVRLIKNKSQYLSLHSIDELERLATSWVELYPTDKRRGPRLVRANKERAVASDTAAEVPAPLKPVNSPLLPVYATFFEAGYRVEISAADARKLVRAKGSDAKTAYRAVVAAAQEHKFFPERAAIDEVIALPDDEPLVANTPVEDKAPDAKGRYHFIVVAYYRMLVWATSKRAALQKIAEAVGSSNRTPLLPTHNKTNVGPFVVTTEMLESKAVHVDDYRLADGTRGRVLADGTIERFKNQED